MSAQSGERLTLHSQSHSPYARKTIVFAHEAGIADREFGHRAGEHADHLVGDVVLHQQHARGRAALAG